MKYNKLKSLSPDEYELISEQEALWRYIYYLQNYLDRITSEDLDTEDYKTFEEWLNTEI